MEASPDEVLEEIETGAGDRVSGSAVFLTEDSHVAPLALRTVVESGYRLAEHVVLLSWHVEDTPAAPANRAAVDVETYGGRYEGISPSTSPSATASGWTSPTCCRRPARRIPMPCQASTRKRRVTSLSEPIPRLDHDNGMALWRQRLFLLVVTALHRPDRAARPPSRTDRRDRPRVRSLRPLQPHNSHRQRIIPTGIGQARGVGHPAPPVPQREGGVAVQSTGALPLPRAAVLDLAEVQ